MPGGLGDPAARPDLPWPSVLRPRSWSRGLARFGLGRARSPAAPPSRHPGRHRPDPPGASRRARPRPRPAWSPGGSSRSSGSSGTPPASESPRSAPAGRPLARSRHLAHLEPLAQRPDLGAQRGHLLEPADRDLDGRHQVRLGERLDQVGHGARVARPLHQFHAGRTRSGSPPGRSARAAIRSAAEIPSRTGILTSRITRSGFSAEASSTAFSPSAASPATSVALFLQHLLEVEPDQRLVFGYDHAEGVWLTAHEGTETGRSAPVTPRSAGSRTARYAGPAARGSGISRRGVALADRGLGIRIRTAGWRSVSSPAAP